MNAAELGLVFMASLLTFAAGFAVPFKKNGILVRLSFWLVTFLLELCVLLIQRAGVTGKFAATAFELLTNFVLIGVYCKGIIWKNFIVYFVTTQFSNIVMAVETILFPDIGAVYSAMVARRGHIDPVAYIVLVAVNMVVAWLNALLVRGILKPEILSGANVYRAMTLILMTFIVLLGSLGHEFVDEMKTEHGGDSLFLIGFWIGFTIIWILVFNVIAFIYNRAEKHRIRSRKALIAKLANDNYKYYRDLARSNDELRVLYSRTRMFRDWSDRDKMYAEFVNNMETETRDRYEFSLSGCLAVDALLYEYSEKAKERGIRFSAVMEPFSQIPVSEQDAAAIVEYLMESVFVSVAGGNNCDSWIMLDWRMRNGMMIVVLAYHSAVKKHFSGRNIEFVRDIVSMHYGVVQTVSESGEDQIRLFIPSQGYDKETEGSEIPTV